MTRDWLDVIEAELQRSFLDLYDELRGAFDHPFDWIEVLERPRWWHVGRRRAHARVCRIFCSHGFYLDDRLARKFLSREPQRAGEDAGGAIIRQLRQTFQYQAGVPYDLTAKLMEARNAAE